MKKLSSLFIFFFIIIFQCHYVFSSRSNEEELFSSTKTTNISQVEIQKLDEIPSLGGSTANLPRLVHKAEISKLSANYEIKPYWRKGELYAVAVGRLSINFILEVLGTYGASKAVLSLWSVMEKADPYIPIAIGLLGFAHHLLKNSFSPNGDEENDHNEDYRFITMINNASKVSNVLYREVQYMGVASSYPKRMLSFLWYGKNWRIFQSK